MHISHWGMVRRLLTILLGRCHRYERRSLASFGSSEFSSCILFGSDILTSVTFPSAFTDKGSEGLQGLLVQEICGSGNELEYHQKQYAVTHDDSTLPCYTLKC